MKDGDVLHISERLYVDLTNESNFQVHMALLDLGIRGDVTLLTTSVPTGIPIAPGGRYTVGERDGLLIGLKMGWKDDVPQDGPRREGFVAIAAEEPTNFRALERHVEPMKREGRVEDMERGEPLTPLGALLLQIGTGMKRDADPDTVAAGTGRYLARHVEIQLSPFPRPVPGRRAHFAVDQSLAPAFLSREAPTDKAYEGEIAIRLKRLIVHDNRAYWRTNIRVDALVVTGPDSGAAPYLPMTFHFPGIDDEDALPFNDLLVYAGRPLRYLDFAIWASKDKPDSKPLSELIKDVLTNQEFQTSATALVSLAVAAPAAAGLVAAAAAAGTIGYFAEKVISAAVGSSIGLYRTSFLPRQAFGRGRHPAAGLIRAQDFSLAFEVTEL